jgi:hypothetical protein
MTNHDLLALMKIINTDLRLQRRITRAVDLWKHSFSSPRLFLVLFHPALYLAFVGPITDQAIPISSLVQLCASCLGVQWQRNKVLNGAMYLTLEDVFAQQRLRTKRSADSDTMAGIVLQRTYHTRRSSETAGDVHFCLLQQRSQHLCELDEVALSGFCAFFLVLKGTSFECAA